MDPQRKNDETSPHHQSEVFDALCDVCTAPVRPAEPRWRCADIACDNVHVCAGCCALNPRCPTSAGHPSMFRDAGGPETLHRMCYSGAVEGEARALVHPRAVLSRALRVYAHRPLLLDSGSALSMHHCANRDEEHQSRWWSFAECGLASRLLAKQLCGATVSQGDQKDAVVIAARNSLGWIIADLACCLAYIPSIVVDAEQSIHISVSAAVDAADAQGFVVTAVVADNDKIEEWRESLAISSSCNRFFSTDEVAALLGSCDTPMDPNCDATFRGCNENVDFEYLTCLFTSGSTGVPKPIWYNWRDWTVRDPLSRIPKAVSCAAVFSPLSHGMARRQVWREVTHGGRVCLVDSQDEALLEKISVISPTYLTAPPRFFSMIQRRFADERAKAEQSLGPGDASECEALEKVRRLLGTRLELIGCGGAIVPRSQLLFLRDCFGIGGAGGGSAVVSNLYGMTETGGILRDGVPLPGVDVELDNVNEEGVGEIKVKKTVSGVIGELDAEGWFHTGDLGRWTAPEHQGAPRRIEVVDRINNCVKLSNGEFFTPAPIEALLEATCVSIDSCALIAGPGDDAAVAVVIPVDQNTNCDAVLAEIRERNNRLQSWQLPHRVIIDNGPWDEQNGCRTGLGKLKRNAVKERVRLLLDQADALQDVVNKVAWFLSTESDEAATEHLGVVQANTTFAAVGGDSIAAAELVNKHTSLGISVQDLVGMSLWELRRLIQEGSFTVPAEATADFWKKEANSHVIDDPVLFAGERGSCFGKMDAPCILLTGCTGFLGPHLLRAITSDCRWATIAILCRPPITRVEDLNDTRIRVFISDISKPRLGLSDSDIMLIRQLSIDTIVHNAAVVDHIRGYNDLLCSNVEACERLVQVVGGSPNFLFVSSLSAVPRSYEAESECILPSRAAMSLRGGYGQTKLVAEQRLSHARSDGWIKKLLVVRLGLIGPHSVTREGNRRDFLHLLLDAIVATRAVPLGLHDAQISMVPVDTVATSLAALSAWLSSSCTPDTYVVNVDAATYNLEPMQVNDLISERESLSIGGEPFFRHEVPLPEWRELVLSKGRSLHAVLAFVPPDKSRIHTNGRCSPYLSRRRAREVLQKCLERRDCG